ncbi:hypothetical protein BC831DRAFT_447211 [Entophlyctis helioformis]|nr:hypothetical protein BC831DRAFT_447211 [Entophlyctis helioformis]
MLVATLQSRVAALVSLVLVLLLAMASIQPVSAAGTITAVTTTTTTTSKCRTPRVRREFRELTLRQRQRYINAVLCLRRPGSSKLPASAKSPTRFDDIVRSHSRILSVAHGSAIFLPWHRSFLHNYETILRTECGYTDPLPYWDWTVDSQAPESSELWSPSYFGGDGVAANGSCVATGPFASYTSVFARRSCLARHFGKGDGDGGSGDAGFAAEGTGFSPESIYFIVKSAAGYDEMRWRVEYGPHANVHIGVDGTMAFIDMSTNDPIFMLHHANVDRIWQMWQQMHPEMAMTYDGDLASGVPAQMSDKLAMSGLMPGQADHTAKQMLNTVSGSPLCYTYSDSIAAGVAMDASTNILARRDTRPSTPSDPIAVSAADIDLVASVLPTTPIETPPRGDRSNKLKLRCPAPMTPAFIAQMRLSADVVAKIREQEAIDCGFITYVNEARPDYVSRSALVLRENRRLRRQDGRVRSHNRQLYDKLVDGFLDQHGGHGHGDGHGHGRKHGHGHGNGNGHGKRSDDDDVDEADVPGDEADHETDEQGDDSNDGNDGDDGDDGDDGEHELDRRDTGAFAAFGRVDDCHTESGAPCAVVFD